jgi:hypothetical protein
MERFRVGNKAKKETKEGKKEMIDPSIKSDIEIMKKYKDGKDVDEIDMPHIRELCSIGLMKTGISIKRKVITAKTIGIGLKLIGEVSE